MEFSYGYGRKKRKLQKNLGRNTERIRNRLLRLYLRLKPKKVRHKYRENFAKPI